MSDDFRFDEDAREDMMLLEFSDSPIGTEEQIDSYISKIEAAINHYLTFKNNPPIKEQKNQLKATYKAVMAAYEQLFGPGEILQYLRNSYAYLNDPLFTPPDRQELHASFAKILWMIDNQLCELKHKRKTKVPEAVHRFTTALVSFYFAEFGKFPEIAARKTRNPDKAPPLQHPFTHFLDIALDALVSEGHLSPDDRPIDTKYLIKKSIEEMKFYFATQLATKNSKSLHQEN